MSSKPLINIGRSERLLDLNCHYFVDNRKANLFTLKAITTSMLNSWGL